MNASTDSLELLLRANRPVGGADLKIALSRLTAETAQRVKKGGSDASIDYVRSVVRLISKIRGRAHADLRIACLFDCGGFLFSNSIWPDALDAVYQLDNLTKWSSSAYWHRKAQMLGAMIHADLGNVADAVVRYSTALKIAKESEDFVGEIAVLCNLGAALNYGGLHREAIPCLERAMALCRSEGAVRGTLKLGFDPHHFECVALTNLAQSLYFLEDLRGALDAICLCLSQSPSPTDAASSTSRIVREFTYVRIALDRGMIAEARSHTSICERLSPNADRRSRTLARICSGLCEVYAGDVD